MSEQNKEHPVSFCIVKDLSAWIESLPDIPWWRSQEIKVRPYSTKSLMVLYWQDGLKVIKHLFSNPVFASCIDFNLYCKYEKTFDGCQEHVYGEFMSADHAWEIQVHSASQVIHYIDLVACGPFRISYLEVTPLLASLQLPIRHP